MFFSILQPVSCTNTHHDITELVNHGAMQQFKILINPKAAKDMDRETKTESNYLWKYILL